MGCQVGDTCMLPFPNVTVPEWGGPTFASNCLDEVCVASLGMGMVVFASKVLAFDCAGAGRDKVVWESESAYTLWVRVFHADHREPFNVRFANCVSRRAMC